MGTRNRNQQNREPGKREPEPKTGFIHENVLFCVLRDFILKRVFILPNKQNSIQVIVEAVTGINRE